MVNNKIIAPCGIDCFNCELYENNVTEEFQKRFASTFNVPHETISCKGCCEGNKCLFLELEGKSCKTLECVQSKGVTYCFECDNFPCEYLMPLAKGAEKFPQNIKLYNLCLMKKIGVEAWSEQAKNIRNTYFSKPVVIGEGGSK